VKILNKYILKSFLIPFLATFFIILFVLVMQTLWLQFDKIAGKGIGILHILKFVGYLAQMQVPLALPIAILLSSIMALGSLSENYEFAAVKSAGISLYQFIRPLIILMFILSGLNFLFLNYAFPRAAFKFKNMLVEMKKTQPTLALVSGTFNTEIPGHSIKFSEKYGEEDNLLKDVLIYYDLDKIGANLKSITAKNGEITTEEGSKYMTIILKDGYHYEDLTKPRQSFAKSLNMPGTKAHFDEYTVNIDISKLSDINARDYKADREMLSLKQLNYYTDSLSPKYDEYVKLKAKNLLVKGGIKPLGKETTDYSKLQEVILDNFNAKNKVLVLDNALENSKQTLGDIEGFSSVLKRKQKSLNVYDTEYHRRIAFSLACLVLFFIGAPLGSIIRKGGFGFPMIVAIVVFVIYFFISTFGRNMAWSSTVSAPLGGWLATIVLLPLGFLLMRRAAKDKGFFDMDKIWLPIVNFFTRVFTKNKI